MTVLDRPYGVRIYGEPVPQGSMTCVGQGGFHNVQPSNKRQLEQWRTIVNAGGRHIKAKIGDVLVGPLGVEVTLTVLRPPSVEPARRPWPFVKATETRYGADVDKLARAILDGLCPRKGERLFADDAQVVELIARKVYSDSPDARDALDRPGAVIRIYPIQ